MRKDLDVFDGFQQSILVFPALSWVFQSWSYCGITLQQITRGAEDTGVCSQLQELTQKWLPSLYASHTVDSHHTGVLLKTGCGPFNSFIRIFTFLHAQLPFLNAVQWGKLGITATYFRGKYYLLFITIVYMMRILITSACAFKTIVYLIVSTIQPCVLLSYIFYPLHIAYKE